LNAFFFAISSHAANEKGIGGAPLFVSPIIPVFFSINISIFLNNLSHFLEEVVKTHLHHIFSCCLDDFLGVCTGGAADRAVHAGGAAKESLSHSLSHRELSLYDLFHEDHFPAGIRNGSFGQIKDRANRPAEATARALGYCLAAFFVKLKLDGHYLFPINDRVQGVEGSWVLGFNNLKSTPSLNLH
jgi:hypothetical protein